MNSDEQLLQKRFNELAERAAQWGTWVYSDFLSTAQQSVLSRMKLSVPVCFEGGYGGAERQIACFGNEEMCGFAAQPPFVCLEISPLSQKFADALSHRDFLGSVMALGVKREVLGDIIVHKNIGYIFCIDSVSKYISDSLGQVRHTSVKCAVVTAPPVESVAMPEKEEIVVASERLDTVVAEVYNLSRSVVKLITEQGKISVNSILSQNPSHTLCEHDVVSVRGMGRFIYEGIIRETKKGKFRAAVRIYR